MSYYPNEFEALTKELEGIDKPASHLRFIISCDGYYYVKKKYSFGERGNTYHFYQTDDDKFVTMDKYDGIIEFADMANAPSPDPYPVEVIKTLRFYTNDQKTWSCDELKVSDITTHLMGKKIANFINKA